MHCLYFLAAYFTGFYMVTNATEYSLQMQIYKTSPLATHSGNSRCNRSWKVTNFTILVQQRSLGELSIIDNLLLTFQGLY